MGVSTLSQRVWVNSEDIVKMRPILFSVILLILQNHVSCQDHDRVRRSYVVANDYKSLYRWPDGVMPYVVEDDVINADHNGAMDNAIGEH